MAATDAAAAIRTGELRSTELVESVLERIDDRNGALNALVSVDAEGTRRAASGADRAVERGDELGPLHGVPVTIKANLDVEGQPTSAGVVAFADKLATADAPAVRNLRRAGAIVLGRSNMPEFGLRGVTDGPLFGAAGNPWHPVASPGGSSGGAAAAAAAGMGPLHQGSDIGGSLRFPSIGCGVASVKPTSNRVPAFNSSSGGERGLMSQTFSVQGIIAREVRDVRLATSLMIGPDPRDPNSPPVPWDGPPLTEPVTVAVSRDWGPREPHPDVVALHDRAAGILADAGYRVVEAKPPPIEAAFRGWFSVATTELALGMLPTVEKFGSDDVRQLLEWTVEAGEVLDGDGYLRAIAERTAVLREWNLFLDELVLTPFLTGPMYDGDFDTRSLAEIDGVLDRAMHAFGVNYLGLPAGTIGMDLVDERPSGVQLVGRRFREDVICDALEAIEATNGVMAHRLWERERT